MFGKKQHSSAAGDAENGRVEDKNNALVVVPSDGRGRAVSDFLVEQSVFSAEARAEPDLLRYANRNLETPYYVQAKVKLIELMLEKVDFRIVYQLAPEIRKIRVADVVSELLKDIVIPLTEAQTHALKAQAIDEILGLGPLEPLLADPEVSDIMINTAKCVYIEKLGKIYLTDVVFVDERHLRSVVQRIVSRVGRRVDESSPMVDARLEDGSRFNAIIPPLALDGCLVSIRKFKQNKMPLRGYLEYESMSEDMCSFLEICGRIRLNIIISGGTGSGKTTLLNALSGEIDKRERVITIEDAAELQLHQPHVLRLETRPMSSEGVGEVTQRQLVKNALRMRPDRIILGEIRGDEVIDVLSAMNTGHDGSMATIHANSPKDCLSRIENLVGMSGVKISESSLRYQIASAVNIICQIARMRDGRRRIVQIDEVAGMDGENIITNTIFQYRPGRMNNHGILDGEYICSNITPLMLEQAEYFGLGDELRKCLHL